MMLIEVGLPHLQLYIQAVSVTGKAEFLKTQKLKKLGSRAF
jgi:hypothetical protein